MNALKYYTIQYFLCVCGENITYSNKSKWLLLAIIRYLIYFWGLLGLISPGISSAFTIPLFWITIQKMQSWANPYSYFNIYILAKFFFSFPLMLCSLQILLVCNFMKIHFFNSMCWWDKWHFFFCMLFTLMNMV